MGVITGAAIGTGIAKGFTRGKAAFFTGAARLRTTFGLLNLLVVRLVFGVGLVGIGFKFVNVFNM